jgi:hypothetical protein
MGTAKEARSQVAGRLTPLIPYAAAIGGGAFGPEGAIIGGMVGKDIQSGIEGKGVPTAREAIGEGVKQGALDLFGRGMGKAAQPLARGILKAAAKLSPESADVAIKEGITATKGRFGLEKLKGRIEEQSKNLWRLIRSYEQRGIKFDQGQLATDINNNIEAQLVGRAISKPEIEAAATMTKQFLEEHPGPISPVDLQLIKQSSDNIATPIYEAMKRAKKGGPPIPFDQVVEHRWHKAMADEARKLLEFVDTRMNPQTGMMESPARMANAETQKLINLRNELFPEVEGANSVAELVGRGAKRGAGPVIGAAIGASREGSPGQRATHGAEGAIAGALLTSPQVLTTIAIHLPWLMPLLGQAPRAAGAAIEASE